MILIIGATSFIGVHTSKAFLDAGYEVIGTGRNSKVKKLLQNMGVKFLELDVTNEKAFDNLPKNNIEAVIHLAAFMSANSTADLKTTENAVDYFKVNLLGTAYTLEYCRKNNIKKIIAACSFRDVSGAWGTGRIITEDEPRSFKFIGDHAAYIISKNASNDLMDYYNLQHDMQCACFRFPRVYGIGPNNIGSFYVDGQKRLSGVAAFIDKARKGKTIELWGNPKIKRDMVYIKDVTQAYVKAVKSEKTLGLYNITGNMQVTLENQAQAAIQVFGGTNTSKIKYLPEKKIGDNLSYLYSIDKAKRDFGYEPQYTDFVKIMQDYKIELESSKWDEWLRDNK